MSRICFLGIFLATFALSFVISIMRGFEAATYKTMQNIYPDLILDAHNDAFDMPTIEPYLINPKYNIAAFSPQLIAQGMIYNPEYETAPLVIQIRGINPKLEEKTSNLYKTILNQIALSSTIEQNQILIGKKIAQSLHVLIGEKIRLLYSISDEASNMKLEEKSLTIGGLFETGIDEYDCALVYFSNNLFQSLFPTKEVTLIHLKLKNIIFEHTTKKNIQADLGIEIYSWKDLYPTLISAMKLESLGMFLILLLIILIATINIMSILFMYIHYKKKDIALFTCMGLSQNKIKYIFLCISLFITTFAACSGIIMSYFMGILLQAYPIITLPENMYYSSKLPLDHSFYIDGLILLTTLCISFLASLIPLQKISRMNIAMLIKNQ
jgi:ABC-type lipoprotein release transport system permease subunit